MKRLLRIAESEAYEYYQKVVYILSCAHLLCQVFQNFHDGKLCFMSLFDVMFLAGRPLHVANKENIYSSLKNLLPTTAVGFQKYYHYAHAKFGLYTFQDYSDKLPFSGEVVLRVVHPRDISVAARVFASPAIMLLSISMFRNNFFNKEGITYICIVLLVLHTNFVHFTQQVTIARLLYNIHKRNLPLRDAQGQKIAKKIDQGLQINSEVLLDDMVAAAKKAVYFRSRSQQVKSSKSRSPVKAIQGERQVAVRGGGTAVRQRE